MSVNKIVSEEVLNLFLSPKQRMEREKQKKDTKEFFSQFAFQSFEDKVRQYCLNREA